MLTKNERRERERSENGKNERKAKDDWRMSDGRREWKHIREGEKWTIETKQRMNIVGERKVVRDASEKSPYFSFPSLSLSSCVTTFQIPFIHFHSKPYISLLFPSLLFPSLFQAATQSSSNSSKCSAFSGKKKMGRRQISFPFWFSHRSDFFLIVEKSLLSPIHSTSLFTSPFPSFFLFFPSLFPSFYSFSFSLSFFLFFPFSLIPFAFPLTFSLPLTLYIPFPLEAVLSHLFNLIHLDYLWYVSFFSWMKQMTGFGFSIKCS